MEIKAGPIAQREIEIASARYEEQRPGLGHKFLDEFNQKASLITEYPELGKPLFSGRRKILLTRFPYYIVYIQQAFIIRVIAVAHQKQRPQYWRNRVEEPVPIYA